MSYRRRTRRGTRSTAVAVLVVVESLFGVVLGGCSPPSPSSGASPSASAGPAPGVPAPSARERLHNDVPGDGLDHSPGDGHGGIGVADGEVPDGVTVFDDYPAVTNLGPALLAALRRAATMASGDGVEFVVNSGWRSPAYQEQLLDEAIAKYGSRKAAARWVATPATSSHVLGDAVDLGLSDAMAWLSGHGPKYGLCQIYRNEPWHYELRPEAAIHGCPELYADPTPDPRMHQ